MRQEISVIRLSERGYRDLRITTHCCLVTRAFGGKEIFLDETCDPHIARTVDSISKEFGGDFHVKYEKNVLKKINQLQKEGKVVVHLTMYGEKPTPKILQKIRHEKKVTIVIGSEKVPGEVYQTADYNISITRQPHSEVAALAVMMHMINEGKEEELEFDHAKKRVIPEKKGKRVEKIRNEGP
jgi:tRNA (cytidine56-2'-O)-methyltransferase